MKTTEIAINSLPKVFLTLSSSEIEDRHTIIKVLCKGEYGQVVLAKSKSTGDLVAIKSIAKTKTKHEDFLEEVTHGCSLSVHKDILQTYTSTFEAADSYNFVMEYARFGNMYQAVSPRIGLSEINAKIAFKQIISALQFMHDCGIVHRDVKPENMLLLSDDFSNVKLSDFGMARFEGTLMRRSSSCVAYTPPEVVAALPDECVEVSQAEDSWSLGVTIFTVLTGKLPWKQASNEDKNYNVFLRWQSRKTASIPPLWTGMSVRMLKFFRRILHPKASDRASVSELCKYWPDRWTVRRKGSEESDECSACEVDFSSEYSDTP